MNSPFDSEVCVETMPPGSPDDGNYVSVKIPVLKLRIGGDL